MLWLSFISNTYRSPSATNTLISNYNKWFKDVSIYAAVINYCLCWQLLLIYSLKLLQLPYCYSFQKQGTEIYISIVKSNLLFTREVLETNETLSAELGKKNSIHWHTLTVSIHCQSFTRKFYKYQIDNDSNLFILNVLSLFWFRL